MAKTTTDNAIVPVAKPANGKPMWMNYVLVGCACVTTVSVLSVPVTRYIENEVALHVKDPMHSGSHEAFTRMIKGIDTITVRLDKQREAITALDRMVAILEERSRNGGGS